MTLTDDELEQVSMKLAHVLNSNWVYVDTLIKVNLHCALTKHEGLKVARRALDIIEEQIKR